MLRPSWLRAASAWFRLPPRRQAGGRGKRLLLRLEGLEERALLAATISTIAGTGTAGFSGDGGPATSATLMAPTGVAVDAGGDVFIADVNNGRIRKVTPDGLISTFAGTGTAGFSGDGGQATSAQLNNPINV